MQRKPGIGRRSFLKSGSAVGVGLSLGSIGALNIAALPVRAAEEPTKHWEDRELSSTDSNQVEYRFGLSHSVCWYGAFYTEGYPWNGAWEHRFRNNSTSRAGSVMNGDHAPQNHIALHGTTHNSSAEALQVVTGDGYFGVGPTPSGDLGDDTGYQLALWAVTYALGKVSPWIAAGLTAAQVIDILLPEQHIGSSGDHEDRYDYTYNQSETNHYRWIELMVEPNDLAYYDVHSYADDAFAGTDPTATTLLEIDGGSDPTDDLNIPSANTVKFGSSDVQEVWRTDKGTLMYTKDGGWTIERIPVDRLKTRGRALNWRDQKIQSALDENEPVYFAHDAPLQEVS